MNKFEALRKLKFPVKDEKIQRLIDKEDSISYSRAMAIKALKLTNKRIESILSNEDTDDFDLNQELNDIMSTIGFALRNLTIFYQ